MGLLKNQREQLNFVVAGYDRTRTNGIFKRKGQLNYIVAGYDRVQTNGIFK